MADKREGGQKIHRLIAAAAAGRGTGGHGSGEDCGDADAKKQAAKKALALAFLFQGGGRKFSWFAQEQADVARRRVLLPACGHLSVVEKMWDALRMREVLSGADLIYALLTALEQGHRDTVFAIVDKPEHAEERHSVLASMVSASTEDANARERLPLLLSLMIKDGARYMRLVYELQEYANNLPDDQAAHMLQIHLLQGAARASAEEYFYTLRRELRDRDDTTEEEAVGICEAAAAGGSVPVWQAALAFARERQATEDFVIETALTASAANGQLDMLEHVWRNNFQEQPLFVTVADAAAAHGQHEILEWIFDEADGNQRCEEATCSPSAMADAVAGGHHQVAEYLYPDYKDTKTRNTATQNFGLVTIALENLARASPPTAMTVAMFALETRICRVSAEAIVQACTTHQARSDFITLLLENASLVDISHARNDRRLRRQPEAVRCFERAVTLDLLAKFREYMAMLEEAYQNTRHHE